MKNWLKNIALVLVIIVMITHLLVQFEAYREAVRNDTNDYLVCREYYHNNSWHKTDAEQQRYSQRMCHDNWSWWNYEVFGRKLFTIF